MRQCSKDHSTYKKLGDTLQQYYTSTLLGRGDVSHSRCRRKRSTSYYYSSEVYRHVYTYIPRIHKSSGKTSSSCEICCCLGNSQQRVGSAKESQLIRRTISDTVTKAPSNENHPPCSGQRRPLPGSQRTSHTPRTMTSYGGTAVVCGHPNQTQGKISTRLTTEHNRNSS